MRSSRTIEMCIPAYNEEAIIAESVQRVRGALEKITASPEVTVVSNASTDATVERARGLGGVRVLSIEERGKGAAIVAAAQASGAGIFGFIDADLSADPADIAILFGALECGECDIAIGSRLMDAALVERTGLRTFSSRVFNLLRKIVLGISAKDSQCGLKLMNVRGRELLASCEEKGWFLDMEFLFCAERAGLRVREIPIHWNEHRFPGRASKLKVVRDGVGALRAMVRIRWRYMAQ